MSVEVTTRQKRESWDAYFLDIAEKVATRATCLRRQVGALLTLNNRILTTGYNGSPSGMAHCLDEGCLMRDGHCVRCLHAEQNALVQAALHGVSTAGATAYITCQPCLTCMKLLISGGIKRVVFRGDYPDELAVQFAEEAGILLHQEGP